MPKSDLCIVNEKSQRCSYPWGSGFGIAVECTPSYHQALGSNPADLWTSGFFLRSHPLALSRVSLNRYLEEVQHF